MAEEREPITVQGSGSTLAVAAPQVRVAHRVALRIPRTARLDAALSLAMLSVVLTQPVPVAVLQVACTVALEKVLVPRGIALQPLVVGAAHERRVSEKRA